MFYRRITIAVVLAPVCSGAARAQISAATFDSRAPNYAWIAGGVGVGGFPRGTEERGGLLSAWEVWLAHGPIAVGTHASSIGDFSGNARTQRAVAAGGRWAVESSTLMLAGGVSRTYACNSAGEQSGSCTPVRASRAPFVEGVVEINNEIFGLHLSYFRVMHATGHHGGSIGLVLGKLR